MIKSLSKIINVNPVNRLYTKYFKHTLVPVGSSKSTPMFTMAEEGAVLVYMFFKPDEVVDTENYSFTFDGESVTVDLSQFETGEITEEILQQINQMGIHLSKDYIGGAYLAGMVLATDAPNSGMAGNHTLTFESNGISLSSTYNQPLVYLFLPIEVSDGEGGVAFSYYVAIRNTSNIDDWYNHYNDTKFYDNDGTETTAIYIGEQDPGVPVTWSAESAMVDMTDDSKAYFLELGRNTASGFELGVNPGTEGNYYFKYDGNKSLDCFVSVE